MSGQTILFVIRCRPSYATAPLRFAPKCSRAFRRFVCSWFAVPAAAFLAWAPPGIGSDIVISQVYGGGGNSGAAYRNDFVELFNRSSNTVSVAGWSVQYGSAGGSTWQSAALAGSLEPGRYLLLQLASGGDNGGIDDPADGARVRAKRRTQAEYLAALAQERQTNAPSENLVLLGDFNAFPFNDGYVDIIGTIKGTPAPSSEVTLASADLVNPDLFNLTDELPASERYSFNFDGNAQALDHILVSAGAHARLTQYAYARVSADFPESFRSNFNRPERLSDHDAPIAWFALTKPPGFTSITVRAPGEVEVRWCAEPGQTNHIEASSDLKDWTAIATVSAGFDGLVVFTETNAPLSSTRFYRVTVP